MKLITEIYEIEEFQTWQGADWTKERIIAANKGAEFMQILDDLYPDGLTETELNDILWHYSESVFDWLGLDEDGNVRAESTEDE